MTKFKLFVLFVFLLFLHTKTQTICIFKGDHMIRATRTNETETLIEFFGKVIKGWKGIILCPTEDLSNCTTVVGYLPEKVVEIDLSQMHQKNHTFIVNSGVENTFFSKIDDILEFRFTFHSKLFDQWNYISFVESTREKIFNEDGSFVNYQRISTTKENINEIFNKTANLKNSKKKKKINLKVGVYTCTEPNGIFGSGRLDGINLVFFFISAGIFIVTFFLLVYYRNEQPLKSRRTIPFFGVLFQYVFILSGIFINSNTFEWVQDYECYYRVFVEKRFALSIIAFPFFILLRYIVVLNMNKLKKFIYKKSNDGVELSKVIVYIVRFFNILGSDSSVIFFALFIYFFFMFIELIPLAAAKFVCNGNSTTLSVVFGINSTILLVITSSLLIFDMIVNIRMICSCWGLYKYLIKNDVFYFRIEFFMVQITSIIYAFAGRVSFSGFARSFTLTVIFYFYFLIQVWFPLSITIFRKVFTRKEKMEMGNLERIFDPNYQEVFSLFEKFAEQEFSSENLLMKKDIKKYKVSLQKSQMAKFIFTTYLNGSESLLEVNIESKLCDEIKQRIQKNEFPVDLFDSIEKEIDKNMKDTFSRFRFEKDYLIALKSIEIQNTQISH
jgi:hypothetical protein